MRHSSHPRSRKRTYLAVLATLSVAALLAPASWTGPLIGLAQIVVPFQHAVTGTVDALVGSSDGSAAGTPVAAKEHEALRREKEGLEHQVIALSTRVDELRDEVDLLTATRLWEVDGRQIGARGRLIPATVITGDLLSWRASRLVSAGSLHGVRRGDAVASRFFSIDRGENEGVRNGMAILLKEALVGIVEQVGTHTSRVKLLTDVSVQMKVRIGRFTPDGFAPLEPYFWLTGGGEGTMRIADAKRRDVEAGIIQVGDSILSDPQTGALPSAMVIGRVASIEPDHGNPLLSILTIEPAVAGSNLRRVFVFNPEAGVTNSQHP